MRDRNRQLLVAALSGVVCAGTLFLNEWTLATKLAALFSGLTCGASLVGALAARFRPTRS
jgi:hypothetical protein